MVLADLFEGEDGSLEIELSRSDQRFHKVHSDAARFETRLFGAVAKHDRVHASFITELAGLSEADLHACEALQFDGHVFDDMAHPRAALDALEEATPRADAASMLDERRHESCGSPVESLDLVAGLGFHLPEVEEHVDDRIPTPDAGSPEGAEFQDLHGITPRMRMGGTSAT